MPKQYKIAAETGRIGMKKQKVFSFQVMEGPNGTVQLKQGGQGYNPFEIIGFLEVMKSNVAQGIK